MTINNMNRAEFAVLKNNGDTVYATTVLGYTFVMFAENDAWAMGVCKEGRQWKLFDTLTGTNLASTMRFTTRREALEYAEGEELTSALAAAFGDDDASYLARIKAFEKVREVGPMRYGEYLVLVSESAAMMREGIIDPESVRQAMPTEGEANLPEAAAEITLETMKAAVLGWENVAVTQEKPHKLIWIHGATGEHVDELVALGFRRSKDKMGWWIKPTAAAW